MIVTVPASATVTLTTTSPSTLSFSGWSLGTASASACNGNKGTCIFTLSENSALQRFAGSNGTGPLRHCDGVLSESKDQIKNSESITATFIPQ